MKIKLGKSYWLEVYTAKQYDKLYGAEMFVENIKLIFCTVRLDKYKDCKEERFSDLGLFYGKHKLGIVSRGVVRNCTLLEFLDNLRYTWN